MEEPDDQNPEVGADSEGVNPWVAFLLGGATFVAASYILHCKFNMGPWSCQKDVLTARFELW